MSKHIVFTGGGSAGHVTPNIALIEDMIVRNWKIEYVGSKCGIEKDMIRAIGIPYNSVNSGKLRRYFSWKTLIEPFNILLGIVQSYFLLRKLKPEVLFSKGGFVAFPVVVGAWLNRIPVVAHESDLTPGLANRISYPFVKKICVSSDAAKDNFKQKEKVVVTGTPIRKQLFNGKKELGLKYCGFSDTKPCLLVIGGSLGAEKLNKIVRESLPALSEEFQVIHLCGKGKIDHKYLNYQGYCQFEYVSDELPDLFAATSIVVSRSGANSLYEILALAKPHILVPLSMDASRGDQIHNARYFEKLGVSKVINDNNLSQDLLLKAVGEIVSNKNEIIAKIKSLNIQSASAKIISLLDSSLSN